MPAVAVKALSPGKASLPTANGALVAAKLPDPHRNGPGALRPATPEPSRSSPSGRWRRLRAAVGLVVLITVGAVLVATLAVAAALAASLVVGRAFAGA